MGKKITLLSAIFAGGVLLQACGGGGTGSTGSGTVSFYLTDALVEDSRGGNRLSNVTPQKVEITIKSVSLENSQTGLSCQLFSDAQGYTTDLTDLANSMRLIDTANCDPGTYDRFVITVSQTTNVMLNNTNLSCDIDPSLNPENDMNVSCSNGECTIEVKVEDGGLNIVEGQNQVSLDFEINDGDNDGREMVIRVDDPQNPTSCQGVAFEIEEIEPEEVETHMKDTGKEMELEGTVSNVNTTSMSFTITTVGGDTFTVDYSQATTQGIDRLLNLATPGNNLKLEVECSNFDLNTATCTAKEIELKIKAQVLAINTATSPTTVDLDIDGDGITDVSVSVNKIEGNVSVGDRVEVEINGHNGSEYTAEEMEKD